MANFSIVSKTYLEDLLSYNSVLEQRNAILKNSSKKSINKQIEIWNRPFSEKCEKLWKQRKKLLGEFLEVFKETVKKIDLDIVCNISYDQKKTTRQTKL